MRKATFLFPSDAITGTGRDRPGLADPGPAQEVRQACSPLSIVGRYALAVLRIVTALLFLEHGTQKLFGFRLPRRAARSALLLFGIGAILELIGSLLLLVGLFTRPVAFLLAEMAVAYWMFHAPQSPYPVLNGGDAPSCTASCSCCSCSPDRAPGASTGPRGRRAGAIPGNADRAVVHGQEELDREAHFSYPERAGSLPRPARLLSEWF